MILSFHPIIEADGNIICAGREPDENDLAVIREAQAVILPQGCGERLYRLARANCAHVFPNLDARFDFPGKCGQIRLFENLGIPHPPSRVFESVADFRSSAIPFSFPWVLKWNWGGQGETVFSVPDDVALKQILARTDACEASGQRGFIVQQRLDTAGRALRVTLTGRRRIVYWRIQPDPHTFGTALERGGRIDHVVEPAVATAAHVVVSRLIHSAGVQLAGFDFIFDARELERGRPHPLLIEINWFFGRRGLGGSDAYYAMLISEVDAWLADLSLRRPSPRMSDE
jgi:ribosomal protein S6--L-glutamate ligase